MPGGGHQACAAQVVWAPCAGCGPLYTGDYRVQAGDTLYAIANACGAQLDCIGASNPSITDLAVILVGQHIKIPADCSLASGSSPSSASSGKALRGNAPQLLFLALVRLMH